MVGGWSDQTKVILNSIQFKFKLAEVGVELGNIHTTLENLPVRLYIGILLYALCS